jgi:hypothetical protein
MQLPQRLWRSQYFLAPNKRATDLEKRTPQLLDPDKDFRMNRYPSVNQRKLRTVVHNPSLPPPFQLHNYFRNCPPEALPMHNKLS